MPLTLPLRGSLPLPARGARGTGALPRPARGERAGVRGRSRSAADAVALGPAEAGSGLALRTVFAADPAGITELIKEIEQERVVDLPDIGLVPAGIAGDLDMRITAGERPDAVSEIALHDLHMVEIELQLQIGVAHGVDHLHRLGRRVQVIARDVAIVDRLDDYGDT